MNQHAKRRAQSRRQAGHPSAGYIDPIDMLDEGEAAPAPSFHRSTATQVAPEGLTSFVIGPELAGERLDRALAKAAEAADLLLSRTRMKSLIDEGRVTIEDKVITDAKTKVREGQTIVLDVPAPAPAEPESENIPLKIVFEDEHLLIVDKPAGLVVHPAAGHESGTLVNALLAHCGDSLSGIGGVKRPGIVHRIDKDTSGLLVVAKTDPAHQGLAALFADHGRTMSLTRQYLALVWGVPERHSGTVNASLGRHATHREKIAVVSEERGREAITHWQLEESFGEDRQGRPLVSLIRCELETGRTHQIRVHMAHIGHPVLGDPLYSTGFKTKNALLAEKPRHLLEKLHRQCLHAATLGFEHPVTGEDMLFESELPEELQALLDALKA